jgi:tetratricopeptide (TPR) repeat protein/nucleoside phosphorylase
VRDDFPEEVKRIVAQRVGYQCSNPDCRALTSGPQIDPTKALNVGVAAHITAAAPGGPRYDPSLTPEARRHPDNAIWLCRTCAKLVDNDLARFTVDLLRKWKAEAEKAASKQIGKSAERPVSQIWGGLVSPRRAVILTALRDEYLAVRAHLTKPEEEPDLQGTIYERGRFTGVNGEEWEVGIVEIGSGNPAAAAEAERAINHFKASVALFVGVAGGLKDVAVGDVVASTKVYLYESGKATRKFEPRPEAWQATHRMVHRARAEARRDDWLNRIKGAEATRPPRAFVAPIAAGEKVVASTRSDVYRFLRANYGDALAVEKEGAGFLKAAHMNPQVEALVIRGISDLISGKREADASGSQALAAKHASAFAFEVLSKLDLGAAPPDEAGAEPPLHIDRRQPLTRTPLGPLLRPYNAFIGLMGRERELESLATFCDRPDAFRWKVLTGAGGVGKTRLALEVAMKREQADWNSGFLDAERLKQWVGHNRFADWHPLTDTLVVIDYAASKLEDLKHLLERCGLWVQGHPEPARLRLLLLERQADPDSGWLHDLLSFGEGALRDQMRESMEPVLEITAPGREAPDEVMEAILRATFDAWAKLPGDPPPPLPKLDGQELRELRRRTEGRPLFLQMAALRACAENDTSKLTQWGQEELLEDAVRRERNYIERVCDPNSTRVTLVERGVALLTFTGPMAREDPRWLKLLESDARACGYPHEQPGEVSDDIAALLGKSQGGSTLLMPLAPDLLAEAFAVTVLRQKPGLAVQAIEATLKCSGPQAWSPLLRVAVDLHAMGNLGVIESWFMSLLQQRPADELLTIEALIPERSVALARIAVILGERQLQAMPAAPGADAERARILSNLGIRYSELGRREKARGAAERAAEIYGRLAKQNPDAFEPNLAGSLSNLGIRYSELGRREEALGAAERAVAIRERLAKQNPDAFEPNLAGSLNNLGSRYSALGRREGALGAAERAAEIYGRLAKQNPDAFEPNLAGSLSNLGHRHGELGQREEALGAAERAAEIYERLAKQNPDAFEPDLAGSLNNLGASYSELGRREEALGAAERAVAIHERLAKQNPDAFEPDLASSLNNLSAFYSALGRREEALGAAERAVAIRERLAKQNPEAFEPDLAESLNNLVNFYSELGRREEALGAAQRAVAIRERLAKQNPYAFEPDLAGSLNNLGAVYSALGRRDEALGAAERAVEIYGRLAKQNADAFEPHLATSLNNLGAFYGGLGRREEALGAAERAVEIYERLAKRNPDAFEPDLARSLDALGSIWRQESPSRAMNAFKRGVETLRRLFLSDPRTFARPMTHLLNGYMQACESSGEKPDAGLLAPIVEALEKLS